jgi:hypothetical protein
VVAVDLLFDERLLEGRPGCAVNRHTGRAVYIFISTIYYRYLFEVAIDVNCEVRIKKLYRVNELLDCFFG